MVKIKVSPCACKIGDRIAADIFNQYGTLIVAENTIINEPIQKSLLSMNIDDFWVIRTSQEMQFGYSDPQLEKFFESYKDNTKTLEKLIDNICNNDQPDLNDLDKICNSIYSEITECKYIVQFLCKIKNHDSYTFEHSLNVSFYCALICKWLNLSEIKTKNIIKAGLLHDIGKTKIPIELLNKKESLCEKELERIRMHAICGYNIVKDIISLDSDIKLGVLLHHEREDGSGYPYRYSSKQLNINTKIISIADTYDALTSERVYRNKYTPFIALDILMKEGLTTYDINIMNAFINNLIFHYIGSQVLLSSSEIGTVVHIPMHDITRPIVIIESRVVDLSKEDNLKIVSIIRE